MSNKKGSKHFTEETYTKRRDVVVTLLQAGLSQAKVAKTLSMGNSTVFLMEKYDWRQYQEYKKAKYDLAKENKIAKVALAQEDSKEAEHANGWTPTPETQPDIAETVASTARNVQFLINKVVQLSNDMDILLKQQEEEKSRFKPRFFNGRND